MVNNTNATINVDAAHLKALLTPSVKVAQPCIIGRVVEALPIEYGTQFQLLLDDSFIQHAEIAARLRNANLPGSASSIGVHRAGKCSCSRRAESNEDAS